MVSLNQKELNGRLKSLRNQAREMGGSLEYSALKEAFADAELSVEQSGMVWDFLDRNCILIRNINEYDDFFRRVPESEPAGSELRTPGTQNAAAGSAGEGSGKAGSAGGDSVGKTADTGKEDSQKSGFLNTFRKLFGGR